MKIIDLSSRIGFVSESDLNPDFDVYELDIAQSECSFEYVYMDILEYFTSSLFDILKKDWINK